MSDRVRGNLGGKVDVAISAQDRCTPTLEEINRRLDACIRHGRELWEEQWWRQIKLRGGSGE